MGGRPFSPPGEILPMPPEWVARAIERPAGADVALALDQQLYPALVPLIERFVRATGIKVALQEGTCGLAAGALSSKTADITGMCCPPGLLDRFPGVRYHTIGIAAIALIVHPDNPLSSITLDDARRLFGGQVKTWAELPESGFTPKPGVEVQTVARLHCRTRPGHWRLLLDDENLFSPTTFEVPAITDMLTEVSRSPAAMGYETLWHVVANATTSKVKAVRLNGVAPDDRAAVAAGRYPLYRVFGITTWEGETANPAAARLAAWLVERAHEIPRLYGIVPAADLRRQGWTFLDDELVAEPR